MFQNSFGAPNLTAVYDYQIGDISGRLDKAAQMGAYPGQARKLAEAYLVSSTAAWLDNCPTLEPPEQARIMVVTFG